MGAAVHHETVAALRAEAEARGEIRHDTERTDELVSFVFTATLFGGRRRWLACPRCNRRVRVLYSQ